MSTYISILKGIHGGGHHGVKMPGLTALYRELGFLNPVSYLHSGNVVFDTRKRFSAAKLGTRLTAALSERFGFEITAIVRTLDEMKKTIAANPFLRLPNLHPEKLYVTFLGADPRPEAVRAMIPSEGPDLVAVLERDIYVYCPSGHMKTFLQQAHLETGLQTTAVTRHWKTAWMLLEMAASRGGA